MCLLSKTQDRSRRRCPSLLKDRDAMDHETSACGGDRTVGVAATETLPHFIGRHHQYQRLSTGKIQTDRTWSQEEPPGVQVEQGYVIGTGPVFQRAAVLKVPVLGIHWG